MISQSLAHLFRHRDVVMSLAVSLADDHLENERAARRTWIISISLAVNFFARHKAN